MKTRSIHDYFSNDLTNYSCYSTLRMIGSAIDGLKNSSRKIVYTALDKLKQETKVSVFDNQVQSYTQYLHGSCSGVIQNMAASYCGSNNLPLLKGEGNFGSRFVNEPAAPRYVYVKNQPYTDSLFDIRDVLETQYFEGEKIEPKFFVPSLPLLLVNGSMNGLASGFKQHILPRKISDVVDYISGKKSSLVPYIKNFKGEVIKSEGETTSGNVQWDFRGVLKLEGKKALISELPPFIEYSKYLETLESLIENKKIKNYKDNSNQREQTFNFEINFFEALDYSKAIEILKLSKRETEIYNALDEFNKVRTFNSVEEILDYFIDVRKRYMEKQRQFLVSETELKLSIANNKYRFISMIIENKLQIMKRPKGDVENDLMLNKFVKVEDKFDYLLNLQVHSFTKETLEKLKKDTETLTASIKYLKELDVFKHYLEHLNNLKKLENI